MAEYKFTNVRIRDFMNTISRKAQKENIKLKTRFSTKPEGDGFLLCFEARNKKDAQTLHNYLSNHPGFQYSRNLEL